MQTIVISPRLDIVLTHQIQRADQLHALKVDAVKLWHHRLYLRTVEHSHQDRLDDIVIVMAERNFVAAKLLCKMVQMAAAHSRTEIARRIFHMVNGVKNIGLKNSNRNMKTLCVVLDDFAVLRAVSRVHDNKFHFKIKFVIYRVKSIQLFALLFYDEGDWPTKFQIGTPRPEKNVLASLHYSAFDSASWDLCSRLTNEYEWILKSCIQSKYYKLKSS